MEEDIERRKILVPFYEKVEVMPDVPEGKMLIKTFFVEINEDLLYIGKEMFIDGIKLTAYFYPVEKDEALMFLYIKEQKAFDELEENIDKYTYDAVKESYPLLMEALINGRNDNYSHCALIRIENGDSKPFWCFTSKVENIDFSNLDNDYVHRKLISLVEATMNVFKQLNNNKISLWCQAKMLLRAACDGMERAKKIKVVLDVILALTGIGGVLSYDVPQNEK